jgi:cell division protein FtsB
MNLRIAGDIAIQTKPMAELSLEQLMEERQQANYESQVITKNCQLTANQLSQENKTLKADNKDLKEECDRLENSYFEIIAEFSKMSNIQNEILEISNRNNRESLELTNLDKMTDREVQKLDQQFKQKLFQLKEEKEKR